MSKPKKISKYDLIKSEIRNVCYANEPIANSLVSMLVKKGILTEQEYLTIRQEFDDYIDNRIDMKINELQNVYDSVDDIIK